MKPAYKSKLKPMDLSAQLIVLKSFKADYVEFKIGEEFDRSLVSTRTLRQLYEQRFIGHPVDPVVIPSKGSLIRIKLKEK